MYRILLYEWILEVLRAFSLKLIFAIAKAESKEYVQNNEEIEVRPVFEIFPPAAIWQDLAYRACRQETKP